MQLEFVVCLKIEGKFLKIVMSILMNQLLWNAVKINKGNWCLFVHAMSEDSYWCINSSFEVMQLVVSYSMY